MVWNNTMDPGVWYIQYPRNENKSFVVYELTTFQRDTMDNCIWIKTPCGLEWTRYNSLYFSNGVIGVYDPSDIQYCNLLRIEFEDSLDVLTISSTVNFFSHWIISANFISGWILAIHSSDSTSIIISFRQ